VAFSGESPVQFWSENGAVRGDRRRNRVSIRDVVVSSAKPAGSMAGGKRSGVIEEEQRCPCPRRCERMRPPLIFGTTDDPQRPSVMAHDLAGVINEAAAVAGEQPTRGDGVEVTPRVNSVAPRHAPPN
jgi:hypothetical protein